MGNQQTHLQIDHFFDKPADFKLNKTPVQFKINDYDSFICCDDDGTVFSSTDILIGHELHVLKFDSHMRDFEVVNRGPTIARGQGIGVIVDFTRNSYIKLWKDKKNAKGYDLFVTSWPTDQISDAKDVLSSDLSVGYDVYIIDYNNEKHHLCEKHDTRDTKETPIFFSHLKKYAKYDDSEIDDQSDESESTKKIDQSEAIESTKTDDKSEQQSESRKTKFTEETQSDESVSTKTDDKSEKATESEISHTAKKPKTE